MPWDATFPQPNDLISQSPTPIQNNWAYIEATVGTDHFFNDAVLANDGHHKYAQFITQAADSALAAGMGAVEYSKAVGTSNVNQPFWRVTNAIPNLEIRQIPTFMSAAVPVILVVSNVILDFTTLPKCCGSFYLCDPGNASNSYAWGTYFWNGVGGLTVLTIDQTTPGINGVASSGNNLVCTTNFVGTVRYFIHTQLF